MSPSTASNGLAAYGIVPANLSCGCTSIYSGHGCVAVEAAEEGLVEGDVPRRTEDRKRGNISRRLNDEVLDLGEGSTAVTRRELLLKGRKVLAVGLRAVRAWDGERSDFSRRPRTHCLRGADSRRARLGRRALESLTSLVSASFECSVIDMIAKIGAVKD